MKMNRVLIVPGLMLLACAGAFAQTQTTEAPQNAEQLRLLSNQASDLAKQCDENAANEDRLAQSGPAWARVTHQAAAVAFRAMASKNRENAKQYLVQAQQLDRQGSAEHARGVPSAASPNTGPTGGNDYLSVSDPPQVEAAIEAYLNRNGIKTVRVSGNNGATHFVQFGFLPPNDQPNLPNSLYKIYAVPRVGNGGGAGGEFIGITLETNVKTANTGEPLYVALGEANKQSNCSWFIDGADVKCRSWLTIPSPAYPIPSQVLMDKITLMNAEWLKHAAQIVTASK